LETELNFSGNLIEPRYFFFNIPGIYINIIFAVIILFCLALTSGAELAVFNTLQLIRSRPAVELSSRHKMILKWYDNPEYLRSTFKTSEFFLKALFVFIIAISIFSFEIRLSYALLLIVCLTIFYIVILEVISKTFATIYPEKFTLFSASFLRILFFLLTPFVWLSFRFGNWLMNLRIKNTNSEIANELSNSIENVSEIHTDEEDIVKGIVKFRNIDVSQILRPRIDVVAVEYNNTLSDILEVVVESGYSRIPVYNENFDDVAGIVYVKDLLPHIHSKDDFKWQTLIRQPYFVPDSKKVKELLNEFKVNKIHMAVIVDEYGGTIGIVTLEDILEEIVGEISDESDEEEKFYSKVNDNTYIFNAKILLNDFYKILHCNSAVFDHVKGEADTLAGLILELKGEIPDKNEEITYKEFLFKIEVVDSRRIKQIRVIITNGD
jgi:putative hemolysin